jgi:hypothetical protein
LAYLFGDDTLILRVLTLQLLGLPSYFRSLPVAVRSRILLTALHHPLPPIEELRTAPARSIGV